MQNASIYKTKYRIILNIQSIDTKWYLHLSHQEAVQLFWDVSVMDTYHMYLYNYSTISSRCYSTDDRAALLSPTPVLAQQYTESARRQL